MTIEERASLLYKPIEADYSAEIRRNNLSQELKKSYIAGAETQKTIMLGRLIECMNGLMLDTRAKEYLYEYLDKD